MSDKTKDTDPLNLTPYQREVLEVATRLESGYAARSSVEGMHEYFVRQAIALIDEVRKVSTTNPKDEQ